MPIVITREWHQLAHKLWGHPMVGTKKTTADFAAWMHALRAIIAAECPGYDDHPDDWREFFEDGLSPREALMEDLRNGI